MRQNQGIPDKEPTRDEVRAWLLQLTRSHPRPGPLAARAIALLDEGEKDRERLDWLQATGGTITPGGDLRHAVAQWRDAIDQARGA